ncbi:MAG: VTT domain-containing protein [Gammaproteobacteria bacterium]|nr:VTT domain-containing protein [Gammaproteobacteria bacterium]
MNKSLLRIILLIILITGITLVVVYSKEISPSIIENWINDFGILAPLVFMLMYVLGTVLFFPGAALTLVGGALFGPVYGTFYNLTGATIGAAISFLIARYMLSDYVEQKTGGRMKQLKDGVENEGWRFIAFVRLVPLFPFNLLNYALGLTRIKFSHYVIASYICMLPGGLAYTYFGYIGKEAATGGDGLIQKSLMALALVAVILFLPRFISALRRAPMLDVESLKQKLESNEDIIILDVRTAEDFTGEQGHIHNAKNIAVEELASRIEELSRYAEKTIAIVCRTNRCSAKAAQILTDNGFNHVHIVKQGMADWIKKGFAVET